MREDFIGQLEALAVSVPQILQRRFRLGALDPEQAEAAIREPAALDDPRLRTRRFSYTAGAATTILTFLRTKDERGKSVLTDAIDPSQLQIICQHIERSILPGKPAGTDGAIEISEGDLGGQDGLRRIVGDFYRSVLDEFAAKQRKEIRRLCETGLISQSGRRLSQEEGEIDTHFDVNRDTLRELVDLRLLRSEPRVGSIYYELAHDTLTGPILAYRDAQRRKRRRRWLIAAAGVALLLTGVAVIAFVSRSGGPEASGAAPIFPIEIGKDVPGQLRAPDFTTIYEVAPTDDPLLVELRPAGFNGALQITTVGENVTPQSQDLGLTGATEFAVIGVGAQPHRIAVSGSEAGRYVLNVRPANGRELQFQGKVRSLRLPTNGEPLVFELGGSPDQAFVVTLNPLPQPDRRDTRSPVRPLMEIIAPDGSVTLAGQDNTGELTFPPQPDAQSAMAGGMPGNYVISIADPSGSSTTAYDLSVGSIDVTHAVLGKATPGVVNTQQVRTVFSVVSPDDQPLYFRVFENQGYGAVGEVRTPDGEVHSIDPESFALVDGNAGRYFVFVTSFGPTQVTLDAGVAQPTTVAIGDERTGSISGDQGLVLYRVETPEDAPALVDVSPDEGLNATLTLVDTSTGAVEPVDVGAQGEREQIVVPAGGTKTHLVAVTSGMQFLDEGPVATAGDFVLTTRPATVNALLTGQPLSGDIKSGELALYTVTTSDQSPFVVALASGPGRAYDATLDVDGPNGREYAQGPGLFVSDGTPGTYTFTVRTYVPDFGFHIATETLPPAGSPGGGPITESVTQPGDLVLLRLDVPDGASRFVTIATDEDLQVDAAVTDTSGNPTAFSTEPISGFGALTLTDAPGPHVVIITGVAGSGAVQVVSGSAESVALEAGSTATIGDTSEPTIAVVTTVATDGTLAVRVQPNDGASIAVSAVDGNGGLLNDSDGFSTRPTTIAVDASSGVTQIVVSVAEGRGHVTVRADRVQPTPIEPGTSQTGAIREPGDAAVYKLSVADENSTRVTVSSTSSLDPQIAITDPYGAGTQIASEGAAGEPATVCSQNGSGEYLIVVSGTTGTVGDFEISVESVAPDDTTALAECSHAD